jgi:uncharacterized protein YciI
VIVFHVLVTTAEGYQTRRLPYRQANLDYLMQLRARGLVVAGGPAPDGRSCDLVLRVGEPGQVAALVEGSPFFTTGLWTGYAPRSFGQFLEPWEAAPPRPDETRLATVVEGEAADAELASFALIEERGAGRLLLGGFFSGISALALMMISEPADAVAALEATGQFAPGSLRGRPLIHVI